jgi:hypothetical protein
MIIPHTTATMAGKPMPTKSGTATADGVPNPAAEHEQPGDDENREKRQKGEHALNMAAVSGVLSKSNLQNGTRAMMSVLS